MTVTKAPFPPPLPPDGLSPRLLGALRVGICCPERLPLRGRYVPATEAGETSWQSRTGDPEGSRLIVEARREMERGLGLVRGGYHAVSGAAFLVRPPGFGGVVGWLDEYGWDQALAYGAHVHLLRPEVLDRTVFVLGDSHNLYAQRGLLDILTPEEAAAWLASLGTQPPEGREVPYIEALVLGGVDLSRDVEEVIVVSDQDELRLQALSQHCLTAADAHGQRPAQMALRTLSNRGGTLNCS